MASRLCLFAFLILLAHPLAREDRLELIVWDVGQGLWVTAIEPRTCWHFDMGGEKMDWAQLTTKCREKENRVSFSHWDMDHIGLVGRARSALPRLCRMNTPLGPASASKRRMLGKVPLCEDSPPYEFWENAKMKTTNGLSRVIVWKNVLLPGDSSRTEEKIWMDRLPSLSFSHLLVLGHHGSRTSTSRALLAKLPLVKMAIASSRFRRYGHPHALVEKDLREFKIPLLRTEEWGNIHF